MATTIIPDVGAVNEDVTTSYILERVYTWYQLAMGDLDKVDDMMTAEYYAGESDAYNNVLHILTNPPMPVLDVAAEVVKEGLPFVKLRNIPFLLGVTLAVLNS